MASHYPSFTSLLARSSAGDFDDLFAGDALVKPGYSHQSDVVNLTTTYLWKIDNAALVMKNRLGLTGSLFQGPADTTWRLCLHWGPARKDPRTRHLRIRLTYVGNIGSQLRVQAGYEVYKSEQDFRRGAVDLDGSVYSLRNDAGEGDTQSVEWLHHKNVANMLSAAVLPGGALFLGVKIRLLPALATVSGVRSVSSIHEVPQWDLALVGRDGRKVTVHRAHLADWSPQLRQVCDSLDNEWKMERFDCSTLQALKEMLYKGDFVEGDVQGCGCELLEFAIQYSVNDLLSRVCDYLGRNLWREGIVKVFSLADANDRFEACAVLRNAAAKVMQHNLPAIFTGANLSDDVINSIKIRVAELTIRNE
ncbi:uncharacterized protein LOC129590504 [Paramacrobiotus metropolitanus]|uniref:uncharacterized protein LOC129590504 n=1 Tax=Paramacrobiotus metropolitanus TaxID=2943436 RepID=UPI002445D005|nr:uncharacterized protein LOC129590504 [Paramacrobiotus metropolitanus]